MGGGEFVTKQHLLDSILVNRKSIDETSDRVEKLNIIRILDDVVVEVSRSIESHFKSTFQRISYNITFQSSGENEKYISPNYNKLRDELDRNLPNREKLSNDWGVFNTNFYLILPD